MLAFYYVYPKQRNYISHFSLDMYLISIEVEH